MSSGDAVDQKLGTTEAAEDEDADDEDDEEEDEEQQDVDGAAPAAAREVTPTAGLGAAGSAVRPKCKGDETTTPPSS